MDSSDDDSLLEPIPISKNFVPKIQPIIIVDDDDDDVILESISQKTPVSENNHQDVSFKSLNNNALDDAYYPGDNNDFDDDDVLLFDSNDSDIQLIEPPIKTPEKNKDFTRLKQKNSPKTFTEFFQNYNNNGTKDVNGSDDSGEWLELVQEPERSSAPTCNHSTPMVRRNFNNKRKHLLKSGKKSLLSRTKTKKIRKPVASTVNVNKNLFDKGDEIECQNQNEENPPDSQGSSTGASQRIPKTEVLNYLTVRIDSLLMEMAGVEITKTFDEKSLRYQVVDHDENDENICCVTWRCRPQLESLIQEVNSTQNRLFKCTGTTNGGLFEHLLLLIGAEQIHSYLDDFLDIYNDDDRQLLNDEIPNKLFQRIKSFCHKYEMYNVTVIIYKLEQHFRSQRRRLDGSFRRHIHDLMMADGDTQSQAPRRKTTKSRPNRHEMTLDNLDIFLLDCKNKFSCEFEISGETNRKKCTVVNIDNESDLAMALFRYSRSLAEQLYRSIRQCSMDFYAQTDRSYSIDPKDDAGRKELWLQQLLLFPNISSDIAEAIIRTYPTPLSLMNSMLSSEDPVTMLADVNTAGSSHRGHGNIKRVGIELAGKIRLFMTTNDPDQVLKNG